MNCKIVSPLLSAYVDSELTGAQMLQVRQHVHQCPACERELEAIKHFKQILAEVPPAPEMPAGMEDRLLQAVRASKQPPILLRPRLVLTAVAACSVFLCLTAAMAQREEKIKQDRLEAANIERSLQRDQVASSGLDATMGAPIVSFSSFKR